MLAFPLLPFALKRFGAQTQLQPITVLLVYKPEQGDLQKQLLRVPLNPCGFHLLLEVRHTHHETTGSSPLCWAPAERKPGSYVGFWMACFCFRGITVQLWNKEGCMNLISPQCHTNSHVFHTLSRLLLSLWLHRPCAKTFSVPPKPKCDPLP